jgi:hypothetical protein
MIRAPFPDAQEAMRIKSSVDLSPALSAKPPPHDAIRIRSSVDRVSSIVEPFHEHPVVLPHVLHFMQVPLRTKVKLPHSPQASPS